MKCRTWWWLYGKNHQLISTKRCGTDLKLSQKCSTRDVEKLMNLDYNGSKYDKTFAIVEKSNEKGFCLDKIWARWLLARILRKNVERWLFSNEYGEKSLSCPSHWIFTVHSRCGTFVGSFFFLPGTFLNLHDRRKVLAWLLQERNLVKCIQNVKLNAWWQTSQKRATVFLRKYCLPPSKIRMDLMTFSKLLPCFAEQLSLLFPRSSQIIAAFNRWKTVTCGNFRILADFGEKNKSYSRTFTKIQIQL